MPRAKGLAVADSGGWHRRRLLLGGKPMFLLINGPRPFLLLERRHCRCSIRGWERQRCEEGLWLVRGPLSFWPSPRRAAGGGRFFFSDAVVTVIVGGR